PSEVNLFTSPEALMGGISPASDWWGLGMVILNIVTQGKCFSGVNEQVFMIHLVSNGAPIPTEIAPEIATLLRGLLSIDRSQRWQWKDVQAWLNGETVKVPLVETVVESGPAISLAGREFRTPRLFAFEASRAANWDEACDLLAHGIIANWAEE